MMNLVILVQNAIPIGMEVEMKKSSDKSFTLIELLVVIAVISILAGIFALVAEHAMRSARNLNCQSNLRQIGIDLWHDGNWIMMNCPEDERGSTNSYWGSATIIGDTDFRHDGAANSYWWDGHFSRLKRRPAKLAEPAR